MSFFRMCCCFPCSYVGKLLHCCFHILSYLSNIPINFIAPYIFFTLKKGVATSSLTSFPLSKAFLLFTCMTRHRNSRNRSRTCRWGQSSSYLYECYNVKIFSLPSLLPSRMVAQKLLPFFSQKKRKRKKERMGTTKACVTFSTIFLPSSSLVMWLPQKSFMFFFSFSCVVPPPSHFSPFSCLGE